MTLFAIDQGLPHLTLSVNQQTYAVAASEVREIVALQPLTPLPTMPPCVLGLMNLRGTVIPVIDLGEKLGLGRTKITPRTCAMVINTMVDGVATPIAVIADEVIDVVSLEAAQIGPAPAFGSPVNVAYLAGITRLGGRYTIILDLTRILTPEELLATTQAQAKKRNRKKEQPSS